MKRIDEVPEVLRVLADWTDCGLSIPVEGPHYLWVFTLLRQDGINYGYAAWIDNYDLKLVLYPTTDVSVLGLHNADSLQLYDSNMLSKFLQKLISRLGGLTRYNASYCCRKIRYLKRLHESLSLASERPSLPMPVSEVAS